MSDTKTDDPPLATARKKALAVDEATEALIDPQTKYHTEGFAEQKQEWPGLQRDMQPVPDCGETSYRGTGRLKGRHALVTGGDSGIGRAAAIAFAREGALVAINYHPKEQPDAEDLRAVLAEDGTDLVLLPGDLTDESFCLKLIDDARDQLGSLDLLVINAGYQQAQKSIADITHEQFDRTMKTNIYAMFWLSKRAAELMPPGSAIINTASVNSFNPVEDLLDYATTKGAIEIFTKGLAKQLAAKGIRVNAVAPGPVWTPLQISGGQLEGKIEKFGQDTPLGRAGQPAELAGLYVTLAEQTNSFTSGSIFGANGGTGIS